MRLNILSDKRFLVLVAFSFLMVSTALMVPLGHADTAALVPDCALWRQSFVHISNNEAPR
jgi:hypothetical protein